jgi:hypothetical protein
VLTPSTPLAYPQVVSRSFALFRVVKFSVLARKATFCSGFDSRQLHQKGRRNAALSTLTVAAVIRPSAIGPSDFHGAPRSESRPTMCNVGTY